METSPQISSILKLNQNYQHFPQKRSHLSLFSDCPGFVTVPPLEPLLRHEPEAAKGKHGNSSWLEKELLQPLAQG